MRFAFIAQHRGVWQTRQMCQALEVRIPVDRDRAFRFNVTEDSEFA